MNTPDELRSRLEALRTEITELAELDDVTPEQDARLDEAIVEATEVRDELVKAEERKALIAEIAQRDDVRATPAVTPFQIQRKVDVDVDPAGSLSEVRDAAFKLLDQADWADDFNREAVEGALKGRNGIASSEVARRLVATESDAYRSAFFKVSTGAQYALTHEEGEALARANALSPATAGGLGVPVIIDPTILITSGKGLTGILQHARIESISNNEWKGVSAAETSWSFDAEAAQVSDDASTLAQPTVPVHMARGFIPYSIEIGMDYPGFATEMGRLLNSGYQALLAEKLAVGSGSGEPAGIFPTLATSSEVLVTTAGSFGAVDLDKVWSALEERFRGSSTWFMSVDVENRIRAFSAGDNHNRFTVDQTAGGLMMLNGRPVVLSDFAPSFAGATAGTVRNIVVLGDFSNFLVAQRIGMNVELVPHLFGANQRPTGQRGWFAYARIGSDSVVDNAFRRLQNVATP